MAFLFAVHTYLRYFWFGTSLGSSSAAWRTASSQSGCLTYGSLLVSQRHQSAIRQSSMAGRPAAASAKLGALASQRTAAHGKQWQLRSQECSRINSDGSRKYSWLFGLALCLPVLGQIVGIAQMVRYYGRPGFVWRISLAGIATVALGVVGLVIAFKYTTEVGQLKDGTTIPCLSIG